MNRIAVLSALALAALGITPAAAQKAVWRVGDTYVVRADDLDIDSSAGRDALLERVQLASRRFCQRDAIRQVRANCIARVQAQAIESAPIRLRVAVETALQLRPEKQLAAR